MAQDGLRWSKIAQDSPRLSEIMLKLFYHLELSPQIQWTCFQLFVARPKSRSLNVGMPKGQ
jgi:hypothetical protein